MTPLTAADRTALRLAVIVLVTFAVACWVLPPWWVS